MKCPECKSDIDEAVDVCPECGHILSDVADKLDDMVQAASIPNLASLFQAGKDKGLIQAGTEYGSAT